MVNIRFPKTDIVGCRFLKYDKAHMSVHPCKKPNTDTVQRSWDIITDPDDKVYYYKAIDGVSPSVGDIVVVSCATGLSLAEVVDINCLCEKDNPAFVIAVIDMNGYREFLEREKQKNYLAKVLKEKKDALEKEAMYELMAEKDKDFADMLKKYKDLGGSF